jgi:Uma2 family endonuclease
MSSITSISVSEYLRSSYSPDRDFVDGRVEERNVGEHDHAAVQAALILWFGQRQNEWNIEVLPEQRMRISATKFRVPDVCLVSLDQSVEQILTKPPLACIEILSPEDTLRRMQERINDYREFGVANIWVLDPATQEAMTAVFQVFWMRRSSRFRTLQSGWCFQSFLPKLDDNSSKPDAHAYRYPCRHSRQSHGA